ncbi:carboxylesterase/lipase family protein [Streptomyces sp. NPDC059629]|uniref:carboxylesterase/lipase family protein n=1 Tax=Streptomyces sp. NPDC059629 TaxID=3346889 RepID=UPI0036794C04
MSEQNTVEVETAYGKISGLVQGGIARFLGIPYAAAPLGDLLFDAPQPPEPWTGVRTAHTYGPTAPKPPLAGRLGDIVSDPDIEGDEWLNLNVWTPDPQASGLPVLVWIHGGGFTTGSSAVPTYDGATFAGDGLVCVSFNYRLGVYGFGYLPNAPAPANRGLLDQVAALRWVRENIARFGGDPDNVTVAGESAGAMSVLALLARDDGLFHRGIVQSGNGHIGQTPADAGKVLKAVADELGIDPTLQAFTDIDVGELLKAQASVSSDISQKPNSTTYGASTMAACGLSFMPVVDGTTLPKRPIEAIADGVGDRVPLLMGTTTEEFRLFIVSTILVAWNLPSLYNGHLTSYSVPTGSWDEYKKGGTTTYPRDGSSGVASALFTDRMFRIPTYRVAETRSERSGAAPTHLYELGWRSPVTPNNVGVKLGACHSVDLPYAWDTTELAESRKFTGDNPPKALAEALHKAWADFAKTGAVSWAAYDTDKRPVMTYAHNNTTTHQVVEDPRKTERTWWDGHPATN